MLEYINQNREENMVTIEDPIEYLVQSQEIYHLTKER